jgi:hypothetical protein
MHQVLFEELYEVAEKLYLSRLLVYVSQETLYRRMVLLVLFSSQPLASVMLFYLTFIVMGYPLEGQSDLTVKEIDT